MNFKNVILSTLLICVGFFSTGQNQGIKKLYVGTFTSEGAEGIYLCDFNTGNGEITLNKTFKGIDNPSFLTISPSRKYLYAVSRTTPEIEKSGGFVISYKISSDGSLEFINKQISNGQGPCHVDVSKDGKNVAIATYFGGTTSLYKVNNDGSLLPASSIIVNKGSGIDKSRQNEPHAHSIKFSPFDGRIYSADLGTDQLNIFDLINNKLVPSKQKFAKIKPGAGPRHFVFHPGGDVIYVINELNSTVSVLEKKQKKWIETQNISTLPDDFEGKSFCADIHISKDGKYLYGSNRGHNSIAVFSINPETRTLILKATVSVEGDWPRNFVLGPDGKYMLVANQKSGNITVFEINCETGIPTFIGKQIKLPAPVCLEFL